MTGLVIAAEAQVPALPEVQLARAFMQASWSPAAIRAYASDWRRFLAWCAERSLPPLSAHPGSGALFLTAETKAEAKSATVTRRAAAIRYMHEIQRPASPTADPEVEAVMAGFRRRIGTRAEQKAPATVGRLVAMLDHCPDTLAGKRDRVLLALGFSGAFRRSELRAGFLTRAAEAGADVFRMMDVSRHKRVETVRAMSDEQTPSRTTLERHSCELAVIGIDGSMD